MEDLSLLSDDELRKQYQIEFNETARLDGIQMAVKILLNSYYGALGNSYSRFFDIRNAESITLSGQLAIRWKAKKFNEFLSSKFGAGDYVIYIDTDSNYLNLQPFLKAIGKENAPVKEQIRLMDEFCKRFLDKVVEDGYQELMTQQNAYKQSLQSKREALADVGFWVSKKRYAMSVHNSEGVEYETPKVKVLGLEVVRSSTPSAIKEPLKGTIKTILYEGEEQLQAYVVEMRKLFDTLSNSDIASPSGVSDIEKYIDGDGYKSGCPKHVKAAIFHNRLVKKLGLEQKYPLIKSGDKIKFLELKMPNPLKEEVIGFIGKLPVEFKLDQYVDRDGMFEKIYMSAVENITDKIGMKAVPVASLEEFFG